MPEASAAYTDGRPRGQADRDALGERHAPPVRRFTVAAARRVALVRLGAGGEPDAEQVGLAGRVGSGAFGQ